LYFKAADVLIVPYIQIFQSGVPFLAYSFGLPVIATDVGSLREDIVEGRTGFVCRPQDSSDLANAILRYFESELFRDLENRRSDIQQYANERYSWEKVAAITTSVYSNFSRAWDSPVR
jgi:glycosyltransferase involved in cell wall biosynthesis